MIYLDNAATTPILPEAREAFLEYLETFGNPSSMHSFGYKAKCEIEKHRERIANLMMCGSNEIYFTSCGTESNNLAILGCLKAFRDKDKILTSTAEHPSVLETVKNSGFSFEFINVKNGIVDLNHLESLIDDKTSLVSIMHVNNETGSINPINEIYNLIKGKSNSILHVDKVQGYGKINEKINADLISFSSHKIGGFKGIGGLYVKKGTKINPIMFGGGQESSLRSGTENLPLIASFSKVSEIAFNMINCNFSKVKELNLLTRKELKQIKNTIFNNDEFCSPYILNCRFDDCLGETLLHCLERREIYIGIGSACSSKATKPSETLKAMGLTSKQIKESIRISFSPQNTIEEVKMACEAIKEEVGIIRGIKK